MTLSSIKYIVSCVLITLLLGSPAQAWWDKAYTIRQQVTVDASADGANVSDSIGAAVVLVRLHDGNFQFATAQENGADIRFVAADDKTPLAYHIEKYDSLLNEAFVWVRLPDLPPSAKTTLWLYYGASAPGEDGADAKATYENNDLLVYHFSEQGVPAADATGKGNASTAAAVVADGAIIGTGARFDGATGLSIPKSDTLTWAAGDPLTVSLWVRPASIQSKRTIFAYGGLALSIENGAPILEVGEAGTTTPTPGAAPLTEATWHHLAFVSSKGSIELFVNGVSAGRSAGELPALDSTLAVGTVAKGQTGDGFVGEMDELRITKAALPAGNLLFAAVAQGTSEAAARTVTLGEAAGGEAGGHSATFEHVMLFGDIARNMMFDGWVAIGVCVIMIIFGWSVAVKKFVYLNSIQKGSEAFMQQWQHVSSDLTVLDPDDDQNIRSMGGSVDPKILNMMHRSPLFHLYHIGSEEIRHRVGKGKERSRGLSARSIQAIRASLETGLVRENQRMNKGLIFLTISIAGGPYVGLLGTVVGVMITFAIIAKSGEVDVNSIAPGIASALLATVAGLVVAIPALFIYSYLSSRIKDLLAGMQVFIDEFVAKMAEFYPTPADLPPVRRSQEHPAAEPQLARANSYAS